MIYAPLYIAQLAIAVGTALLCFVVLQRNGPTRFALWGVGAIAASAASGMSFITLLGLYGLRHTARNLEFMQGRNHAPMYDLTDFNWGLIGLIFFVISVIAWVLLYLRPRRVFGSVLDSGDLGN